MKITVDLLILARYRYRTVTIPWPYRDYFMTVHFIPLTVHRSTSLTVYRSPFSVHRPPFSVHRPPFTVHRSPSTVHRPPFTVHRSQSTVHSPPFSFHHSASTVQLPPSIVQRPPFSVFKFFLFLLILMVKFSKKNKFLVWSSNLMVKQIQKSNKNDRVFIYPKSF